MTCRCGHDDAKHHHGHSCTAIIDEAKLGYCKCNQFTQGDEMPKEKKARKPKGEGRKPVLAEFIDEGLNIYAKYKGKEFEARVRKDGVIIFRDKEYATPNAAGMAATGRNHGIDGYRFWSFNKDGERVPLDTLRGAKSPLAKVEAKPKKVKAAPKKARKPRATKKSKANGAEKHDVSDKDIPQNEAGAAA
jgi:hypothetical protein